MHVRHSVCTMFPAFIHGFSYFSIPSIEDRSNEKIKKGKNKNNRHSELNCAIPKFFCSHIWESIYSTSHIGHIPPSTRSTSITNVHGSLFILWEPTISWHNRKYFVQNHHNKGIHRALNQISMIIVPLKLFALLQVLLISQTMENVYSVEHGKMVGKNSRGEGKLTFFPETYEHLKNSKLRNENINTHTQVDGAYSWVEVIFGHFVWLLNETISNKKMTLINSNSTWSPRIANLSANMKHFYLRNWNESIQ